jgi:hypothetical protein
MQIFDNGRPTNAPCVVSFINKFTFKDFNCHTQDHMPSYQAPFEPYKSHAKLSSAKDINGGPHKGTYVINTAS